MKPVDDSSRMDFTRRDLVANVGKGLITLGIASPLGKPKATDAPEQLNAKERTTLEAFAETLLPGATNAGIVQYVETQLASKSPLLFARYLDYSEELISFYSQGLKGIEDLSESRFGNQFTALSAEQKRSLARELSQGTPSGWTGPPAPLFYLAVRNDAVDVYYGTQRGFEKLGVPYLALITPPKAW